MRILHGFLEVVINFFMSSTACMHSECYKL
jgi:hypothetical protein